MTSSQCAFSQRKVVPRFEKWNEQPCVLIMTDLQELHRTSEPKEERIRTTRLGNVIRTIYLLGPEPRAALDHVTPLYTALGDTVKKAESITSLSNLVRSIQILISEQTPLMWKPGEKKFYKQISTIHNGSNITTGITCGRNGLMFLSVFKCFTTFPSTLKL